jgi:hypothetical protein
MSTYTPKTPVQFAHQPGGLSKVITTELNAINNSFVKVDRVSLAGGAADAFAFTWQNPESVGIIVEKVIVNVTTAGGTATAVLNVGTAADATTGSDNLIAGADANAAAAYDNITDGGTNGKTVQVMDAAGGTTDYITGQIKTEEAGDLAGYAYIFYIPVTDNTL